MQDSQLFQDDMATWLLKMQMLKLSHLIICNFFLHQVIFRGVSVDPPCRAMGQRHPRPGEDHDLS